MIFATQIIDQPDRIKVTTTVAANCNTFINKASTPNVFALAAAETNNQDQIRGLLYGPILERLPMLMSYIKLNMPVSEMTHNTMDHPALRALHEISEFIEKTTTPE